MLQHMQCVPTCANDAAHALTLVADSPPFDAVLLDLLLPGRAGIEASQALAALTPTPAPVIFLAPRSPPAPATNVARQAFRRA